MILSGKNITVDNITVNVRINYLFPEENKLIAKIVYADSEIAFVWKWKESTIPSAISLPVEFLKNKNAKTIKNHVKDYIIYRLLEDNIILFDKNDKELKAAFTRFILDGGDYLEVYPSQYVRYISVVDGLTYAWQPYVYKQTCVICNEGHGTGIKNVTDASFIREALKELGFAYKSHLDALFANAGLNPNTLSRLAQEARQKAIEDSKAKKQLEQITVNPPVPTPTTAPEPIVEVKAPELDITLNTEKMEELKENIKEAKAVVNKARKKYW